MSRKRLFEVFLEGGVLEKDHSGRQKHAHERPIKKRTNHNLPKRARPMGIEQPRELRVHQLNPAHFRTPILHRLQQPTLHREYWHK